MGHCGDSSCGLAGRMVRFLLHLPKLHRILIVDTADGGNSNANKSAKVG